MIKAMEIKAGLIFTLPIEPCEVTGKDCVKIEYKYMINEKMYSFVNMHPLTLKVISVGKAIVECNIIKDEYNEPFEKNIKISFSEIAEEGTAIGEVKHEMVVHPSHYAWLKKLCGVEPLDICRHLDFNCGSIIKYILRKGKEEKNLNERQQRIQDLKKAKAYLEDEIKMLEN